MVRRRFEPPKTGIAYLKSIDYEKYLTKVGVGKKDHYFWGQIIKSLFKIYAICGLAWWYNETSPLGWFNLKPRTKEEKAMAHLYERIEWPYPGDEEAMEEFIAKGGAMGTTIGPKGVVETDPESMNYQQMLQKRMFDNEAYKMWIRMRNEVVQELFEKGYRLD